MMQKTWWSTGPPQGNSPISYNFYNIYLLCSFPVVFKIEITVLWYQFNDLDLHVKILVRKIPSINYLITFLLVILITFAFPGLTSWEKTNEKNVK